MGEWVVSKRFCAIIVQLHPDIVKINRSIYSALDWLGDVGGLYDGLFGLFSIVISLYRRVKGSPLDIFLVTSLSKRDKGRANQQGSTESAISRIKQRSYFAFRPWKCWDCLRHRKRRRKEDKLFNRGIDRVLKELEVDRFVRTQKQVRVAFKVLFTRMERFLIRNNREFVLDFSSDDVSSKSSDCLIDP